MEAKKYLPIVRNRDETGRILTYSTTTPSGITFERNTLKEIRIIARIVDDEDNGEQLRAEAQKLLDHLNSK